MTPESNPHDSLPLLSSADQKEWLIEHIPHRVRSVLPGIPMAAPWNMEWNLVARASPIVIRGMGNAIWEGRAAAMRWLTMFVGISASRDTWTATRPSIADKDKDVFITRFDGGKDKLFPFGAEAEILAQVWAGCSKAVAHPTNRTNHPRINELELAQALTLVIGHLQTSIYATAGKNLIDFTLTEKTAKQLHAEW
jgi:hypothetical protein